MSHVTGAEDDVFDVDTNDVGGKSTAPADKGEAAPEYRIFSGSRIAISSSVGKVWERRKNAAIKAYEQVTAIWDEVLKYYNNNQMRAITGPRGTFKRGDGTENVMFANLNIMLPAVYSKDPDVTCSTNDESKQAFCRTLENVINTLFRDRQGVNAKPKVKKAVGIGLLTNFGILKVDWTKKDDSREIAIQQMTKLTQDLAKAKTQEEVTQIYGKLEALEMNMEVLKPSGPALGNVLPHNLIIDPYAEQPDGCDGIWMMERLFFPTAALIQRFTKPDPEAADANNGKSTARVYAYKPTHKAVIDDSDGSRDDGIGLVMQAIDSNVLSVHHTDDERTAYLRMYYTECYMVWDKLTKRVMLFHRDDWSWPLWVWDDPLNISRFFPYFIISFVMSTGGTVSVGETAYYLDQQDSINDINRKLQRMRSSLYDYWFYDSESVNSDEIEKMLKGMVGESSGSKKVVGIKVGEGKKVSDMFQSVVPDMEKYKELFDKTGLLDAINRLTNTSDALRGVQFKTNTNEQAVQTYQESMQLSVGSKVDVVEDVVADIANAYGEMSIQNLSTEDVQKLVGQTLAANWEEMDLETYRANYNLTLVAGSMQKPNSVFKKKEAIQVAQSLGQFAQAAPGGTLTVMLRVLEQAFTEVVIKPEDWALIQSEITQKTQQGVGSPAGTIPDASATPSPGQTQPNAPQPQPTPGTTPGAGSQLIEQLKNLPPQIQAEIGQMHAAGDTPQVIFAKLMQHLHSSGSGAPQPGNSQPAPQGTLQ